VSTFVKLDVACPACGVVADRMVATSINASRSPEWRETILAGRFQRFACVSADCDEVVTPLLPFPYIDFHRKQYIGVFPTASEAEWWKHEREPEGAFERNLGRLAPPIAQPIGEGMAVRTVFGLTALREKILVLDAGLDDAIVEVLKLRLLVGRDDLSSDPEDRPRFVGVDGDLLEFRATRPADAGARDVYKLTVPRSDLDAVATDDDLLPILDALRAGPYRDCGRLLVPAMHAPATTSPT
jgi:hypothetical protein